MKYVLLITSLFLLTSNAAKGGKSWIEHFMYETARRNDIVKLRQYIQAIDAVSPEFENGTELKGLLIDRSSALARAAAHQDNSCLKLLLDNGANPNGKGDIEQEVLATAISWNKIRNVFLLLKAGADPNSEGFPSGSPLFGAIVEHTMFFARKEDVRCIEILLAEGADPNIPNRRGTTPLTASTDQKKPNLSIIRLLLQYGANPNADKALLQKIINRTASHHNLDTSSRIKKRFPKYIETLALLIAAKIDTTYAANLPEEIIEFQNLESKEDQIAWAKQNNFYSLMCFLEKPHLKVNEASLGFEKRTYWINRMHQPVPEKILNHLAERAKEVLGEKTLSQHERWDLEQQQIEERSLRYSQTHCMEFVSPRFPESVSNDTGFGERLQRSRID